METLKAVIFDQSTIFPAPYYQGLIRSLRGLLLLLKEQGIKTCIFSNEDLDFSPQIRANGYPDFDLVLTFQDIGKKKGGKIWIEESSARLQIKNYQSLYIGDSRHDWLTAINSGTAYLHAAWSGPLPDGVTAFTSGTPDDVWLFISHFLIPAPRFEYSLDGNGMCVRCLLAASARLPATTPPSFMLQKVLTYLEPVSVGKNSARDILMIHAITSLYLEGLIKPNAFFSIYPSSTPGKRNMILQEFVQPVSKLFHGYFKEDLILRSAQALDTSIERVQAKNENRPSKATFGVQTNTVHLNPKYRTTVQGRQIIVIDDFITTGKSLEWARNLLFSAGVGEVVLLSVGKYKGDYHVYSELMPGTIRPFELTNYFNPDSLFREQPITMTRNSLGPIILTKSFNYFKNNLSLPVE